VEKNRRLFLKPCLSAWNVLGQGKRRLSPLLQKRTIIPEYFFNLSINRRTMPWANPARFASMNAEFQKEGGVIVV
jgi:hypothetical protein